MSSKETSQQTPSSMYEWELESIDSLASAQDRYRQANLELGSRKMFFMVDRHPKKGAQPVTVVVFLLSPILRC